MQHLFIFWRLQDSFCNLNFWKLALSNYTCSAFLSWDMMNLWKVEMLQIGMKTTNWFEISVLMAAVSNLAYSKELVMHTAKNTVISPNFLVWKFCGKTQFLHSFGRFARNYAETVPFRKISTPGNQLIVVFFAVALINCSSYCPDDTCWFL